VDGGDRVARGYKLSELQDYIRKLES
jgi:hypothetical protein